MAARFCAWSQCSLEILPVLACGKRFCSWEHLACWAISRRLLETSGKVCTRDERKIEDVVTGTVQLFKPHEEQL